VDCKSVEDFGLKDIGGVVPMKKVKSERVCTGQEAGES